MFFFFFGHTLSQKGSPTNVAPDLFTVKATLDREHLKQQQSDDGKTVSSLSNKYTFTKAYGYSFHRSLSQEMSCWFPTIF